jgi:Flp pilus assembly protein TadG
MMRNLIRSERGASMVEFALLAPVLILLVIGLIEVGRYTYFGILAAHAAEAGARYGAQNLYTVQDRPGITAAALNDGENLSQWIVTPNHTCSQNGALANCLGGTPAPNMVYYVTVSVTGSFHSLLNYPGVPTSVPVTAYATMRVQNQ